MARALARAGARVSVFCNTGASSVDREGVSYQPAAEWPAFAREIPHDVCIVQRDHRAFSQRTNARLNVLWCHDMALGRDGESFRGALWNVDRTVVLSQYMRRQYSQAYRLEPDAFSLSRNGVDLGVFRELAGHGIQRDRRKLFYGARPERGLDLLLGNIMPRLLEQDPAFRLYVASYDNQPPEWRGFYDECDRLARRLGDRVVRLGSLTKRELYAHYMSAGAYVYPTPSAVLPAFREVSCISAMECQAAGLPIVTTATGALPETVAPGAGALIGIDPSDPANLSSYVQAFTDAVFTLVSDERAWNEASSRALARGVELDWSGVAREWLNDFEQQIRARNDSPARLIRHLWRTSDIVVAKQALSKLQPGAAGDSSQAGALGELLAPWSFMEEPDGYRRQYEKIGPNHDPAVYETTPEELRFSVLERWLRERADGIRNALDFGCAHGAYAIGLAQRLPYLTIHGEDIDRFSTAMANGRAQALGLQGRATFSVSSGTAPAGERYDCALLQEVLEHVPEPWAVLEQVEGRVRVGGKVYITVPFGPWELTSYRSYPHRCHVWHFDAHDLRDMAGAKPDFTINPLYGEDNPITGDPQGWWIVSYTADHRPVGRVDVERHLWLQRPRQSLSAAIIAGPDAEETLHWMLRSIQDAADEIIVADCGMSDEARRIAGQYEARIVRGLDPKVEGFDRARNVTLDECSSDWCLWIDTDEKLVGSQFLDKYLRENIYQSYAVRQHHFACDTSVPLDTPARLFRRRPYRGEVLRFWGAIHEHPELAVNGGAGPTICLPDVHVAHVGYLSEAARGRRFVRNLPLLRLDQERYPDRLMQKHFIMRDNMHLVRYALLASGGRVDDRIRARCRETVALFRTHFLGQSTQMARSSLEYYSEALTVLGEGFEAVFQVEADKTEAKANGVRRYRFASTEDFHAELKRAASEKTARFDSEWW